VKPQPIIGHETQEILGGLPGRAFAASDPATSLASRIDRDGECAFTQPAAGPIQILHLNAVVRMEPLAGRIAQSIRTVILIAQQRITPVRRHNTCKPKPGTLLNLPYDCQPLTIHGSIFSFSVGKTWMRTPLNNHGVFDETYDG
jgi:hypothetical protein